MLNQIAWSVCSSSGECTVFTLKLLLPAVIALTAVVLVFIGRKQEDEKRRKLYQYLAGLLIAGLVMVYVV